MTTYFSGRSKNLLSVQSVEGGQPRCGDAPASWIVVKGSVDRANLEDLDTALALVELNGTASVHLHVSDVDFIDVGGLRVLATFARRVRETGHDMRTCGACPTLRRTALIMDLQEELGLT